MLIPGGVLVTESEGALVAEALRRFIRAERIADLDLLAVYHELETLADRMADPGRRIDDDGDWQPISVVSKTIGVPARTLRRKAARGLVPARKDGGRWLIHVPEAGTASTPNAADE